MIFGTQFALWVITLYFTGNSGIACSMADEEKDSLRNLMKSSIEEVNNRFKSFESPEIEEETFRETLPEGYTYKIEKLSRDKGKFKAKFVAEAINRDNINQWVADYEAINGVTVKIKARKKPSTEYALRHYYQCHHNTRPCSSKDPQRKLLLNPSAKVYNKKNKLPFPNHWKKNVTGLHRLLRLPFYHFRPFDPLLLLIYLLGYVLWVVQIL